MSQTDPPLLSADLLEQLRARWQQRDLAILDSRRPGLQEPQIDELERLFACSFNAELRLWWSWQDGTRTPPRTMIAGEPRSVQLHPGPEFLSGERARSEASMRHAVAASSWAGDPLMRRAEWNECWVPITRNISGGLLICEAGGDPDEPCRIRYSQPGVTALPPTITAESIGQLVAWWIELYDQGLYHYDASLERWMCDDSNLDAFPGPELFRSYYASE